MNICSWVCACATMRISSATASTLAMPARKIAWLSAKISLSIFLSLQEFLGVPYELVRIDHAGHATAIFAGASLIGAHNAPLALNHDTFFAPRNFGRQRDFKLHR